VSRSNRARGRSGSSCSGAWTPGIGRWDAGRRRWWVIEGPACATEVGVRGGNEARSRRPQSSRQLLRYDTAYRAVGTARRTTPKPRKAPSPCGALLCTKRATGLEPATLSLGSLELPAVRGGNDQDAQHYGLPRRWAAASGDRRGHCFWHCLPRSSGVLLDVAATPLLSSVGEPGNFSVRSLRDRRGTEERWATRRTAS
jgi:hypothetical protein